jgi:hypothetical protein
VTSAFSSAESQHSPSTLTREWVLTDTADCTELGTRERVRAKVGRFELLTQEEMGVRRSLTGDFKKQK